MSEAAGVEVPHDENDPFVKKVALSVAIYAVVLAVAGTGGNNAGKEMLLNQLKSTNEFSQYQAKSQRQVMYQQEREVLEPEFGKLPETELENLAKKYADYEKGEGLLGLEGKERRKMRWAYVAKKLSEYRSEMPELKKKGDEYKHEQEVAQRRDPYFDYAELVLQLGIVLASVSMLSKARWPYYISLVLAVVGLVLTANGYFLVAKVPFVEPTADVAEH